VGEVRPKVRITLWIMLLDYLCFGLSSIVILLVFYTSSNLMTPFFIIVGYMISFVLDFWITLLPKRKTRFTTTTTKGECFLFLFPQRDFQ
jgi:hypothetical protein